VGHREYPTQGKDCAERVSRIGLQQRTAICRNEVCALTLILEHLEHRKRSRSLGPLEHRLALEGAWFENVLIGGLPRIDVAAKTGQQEEVHHGLTDCLTSTQARPTTQVHHDLGTARAHPRHQLRPRASAVVAQLLVLLGVPRLCHGCRLPKIS